MLPPVTNWTGDLWGFSLTLSLLNLLGIACKSEILKSLCSYTLLILNKSSKSKNQVG